MWNWDEEVENAADTMDAADNEDTDAYHSIYQFNRLKLLICHSIKRVPLTGDTLVAGVLRMDDIHKDLIMNVANILEWQINWLHKIDIEFEMLTLKGYSSCS